VRVDIAAAQPAAFRRSVTTNHAAKINDVTITGHIVSV
jgi:hypothetical protein